MFVGPPTHSSTICCLRSQPLHHLGILCKNRNSSSGTALIHNTGTRATARPSTTRACGSRRPWQRWRCFSEAGVGVGGLFGMLWGWGGYIWGDTSIFFFYIYCSKYSNKGTFLDRLLTSNYSSLVVIFHYFKVLEGCPQREFSDFGRVVDLVPSSLVENGPQENLNAACKNMSHLYHCLSVHMVRCHGQSATTFLFFLSFFFQLHPFHHSNCLTYVNYKN